MQFIIEAMHCDGCARGVTKAIQRVDPAAEVSIDVPARQVQVRSEANEAEIRQALDAAGFPPAAA